jgi:sugar phosphate isomerase/epimerase
MKKMEVGVFLSSLAIPDTRKALAKAKELGIKVVQLGSPPDDVLTGPVQADFIQAVRESGIEVSALCVGYPGESYDDIPTVARTVGLTKPATVKDRMERTKRHSDLAQKMGIKLLTSHIGVIPEDTKSPAYAALVKAVREIADYLKARGQTFALETGQEAAAPMVQFIKAVGADNLKINFDPANMILYGSGEPIAAMEVLKKHIVHVHCKDGIWPKAAGKLGEEVPLGSGQVGIDRYVAKLKQIGYAGPLTIEREAGSDRIGDITAAKKLLESLRDK